MTGRSTHRSTCWILSWAQRPLRRGASALIVALIAGVIARADETTPTGWTTLAGGADRCSIIAGEPIGLGTLRWTLSTDDQGTPITFAPSAGVAATGARAYAVGEIAQQTMVLAVDLQDGTIDWAAPIAQPVLDSWSSPSLDLNNNTVIVASDLWVAAFDADTGSPRWTATLDLEVVNATPAITDDLAGRNRAFITDYDPLFGGGSLYCINLDPFDAQINPFTPGEIVWSVVVGPTSGATPAYADGVVYLATAGFSGSPGTVLALDATADSAPTPMWTLTNPKNAGFFGGVAVCRVGGQPMVYAASYGFFGGLGAGNLVKIDAATGDLVWSIDTNRTDTIPVVLPDGRIIVSGGVSGFGTVATVEVIHDLGAAAAIVWNSALATWTDTNTNGTLDPGEFLDVGGWTHQPLVVVPAQGPARLYAGGGGAGLVAQGINDTLYAIDLGPASTTSPSVLEQVAGVGSSLAAVQSVVLTIGPTGLAALGNTAPAFDVNADGSVDIDDLYDWYAGLGARDVNSDGAVDTADAKALEAELRKDELADMIGGRR